MVASRVWRAGRLNALHWLIAWMRPAADQARSDPRYQPFSAFGGFGLVIIYSGFTILAPLSGSIGKQAAFREWDGRGRKISSLSKLQQPSSHRDPKRIGEGLPLGAAYAGLVGFRLDCCKPSASVL